MTAAEPPKAAEIERLIRQLGSDKFQEREAAGKALTAIGMPALEALRATATKSPDEEVRRRAAALVRVLEGRDLKRLRSTWTAVAAEAEGMRAPVEIYRGLRLLVRGEEVEIHWPYLRYTGTCRLDPNQSPMTVDVTLIEGGVRIDKALRGIYVLDQDRLTMCLSYCPDPQERPTQLATSIGMQTILFVFQRERAAE
jgi:uncharacterized protein (TIGR03067 family)